MDDPQVAPTSRWPLVAALAVVALALGAIVAIVAVPTGTTDDAAPETTPSTSLPVVPPRPATTDVPGRIDVPPPSGLRLLAAPDLPVPEPLPLDARAPTPVEEIGTLEIPALGVAEELNVGMTLTAIDRGPSWWPGTAAPGAVGTAVVAGHRTTHSRPFHDLDRLVPGDQVVLTTETGRHTYAVEEIRIISPQARWIAEQRWEHRAVLFACHPKGSARFRIAAFLVLVDEAGVPVDDGIEWDFPERRFVDPIVAIDAFGDEVLEDPNSTFDSISIDGRRYAFAEPPPDESTLWLTPDATEVPLDHLGEGDAEA